MPLRSAGERPKAQKEGETVKVLGVVGSPRKGGNADRLIDRVLEGAKEKNADTEKVYLHDLEIHPCQGAFSCEVRKRCVLPDDMQPLYEKLHQADSIVIGTPIYMAMASGPLVKFFNRCRPFISFIESLDKPALSPSEEKALLHENTCLKIWKGKPYAELTSMPEEMMSRAIHSYMEKNPSLHPKPLRRLPKGKKGVIIMTYHQPGEEKYKGTIEYLLFNLRDIWGLAIADVIPAYGLLKKGDAQKREDLMQRAFKAGQLL